MSIRSTQLMIASIVRDLNKAGVLKENVSVEQLIPSTSNIAKTKVKMSKKSLKRTKK